MIENNSTNVFAAFEILLGEIEVEIDFCHKAGAEAFERRDLEDAREVLEYAGQIMVFRDKIVSLSKEWETLSGVQRGSAQEEMIHVEQRSQGRLQRGLRTPEEAYYQPILQILNEQGGSAKMSDVQERLAQVMKGVLREVDYKTLASGTVRWRNTAQFARNTMVKDGRLKSKSPRGIWEISEAARTALTRGTL
jgi:restriction system protein